MEKDNMHSAHGPATGYLYQARLALLLGIRAIGPNPHLELRIEKFDDISFDNQGDPTELIQTKHHSNGGGNLTNASVDLWKTLRIWGKRAADVTEELPALILLTTSAAPSGSAASLLKANSDRNEQKALELLNSTCSTSKNQENVAAYDAFQALTPSQRLRLLQAITVIDGAPDIVDVRDEISDEVRLAAPRSKTTQFVERLEGWWFSAVIEAINNGGDSIKVISIDTRIDELREEFQRIALPVDHASSTPTPEIVADLDNRAFVKQLRQINVGALRIEYAIRDYYRASEQRARWAREDLLVNGELSQYDQALREAWEPRFAAMVDELPQDCGGDARASAGSIIYKWVEQEAIFPLRTVTQAFLTKGSYQILANKYAVGWHPDFKSDAPTDEVDEE
jgi:hypothetical protein